jgi:CrcB-like protein, Camphor Resistance (CrcB)
MESGLRWVAESREWGCSAGSRCSRIRGDLLRRLCRRHRPNRAGSDSSRWERDVALGHVQRESGGSVPARLLHHPAAGTPSRLFLPATAARHRILRSLYHVFHAPTRTGGDGAIPTLLLGAVTLGSYTTFSTWMLESHHLGEDGRTVLMAANLSLCLVLGLLACAVGRFAGGALW